MTQKKKNKPQTQTSNHKDMIPSSKRKLFRSQFFKRINRAYAALPIMRQDEYGNLNLHAI